eukprot:UN27880
MILSCVHHVAGNIKASHRGPIDVSHIGYTMKSRDVRNGFSKAKLCTFLKFSCYFRVSQHICAGEHIIHLYKMLWFWCIVELSDFEGNFR